MPLRWVLFDQNGTLLDPSAIAEPLGGEEPHRELVRQAFDEAVLQSMADTLSGHYRSIPEYLQAALERRVALAGGPADRIDDVMARAARMPAFADAGAAIDRLRAAGLQVGVLTNSTRESAEASLRNAGLRERLDAVIGSDAVRAFKPHPDVYRHAVEEIGASPGETCMVAAHGWDLMGAARVGLRTGWSAHGEGRLLATVPRPDVVASDLGGVAEGIVGALVD